MNSSKAPLGELILAPPNSASLINLPDDVVQTFIFCHFSALELFKMRLICPQWANTIKQIWCHRVKDEMMEQIQSLDLLYEKETTAKILEHKIRHLQMYARMMEGFQNRMNMTILSHNLLATMQSNLIMLVMMTVMIIKPELDLLVRPQLLTQQKIKDAIQYLTGDLAENVQDLQIFNSVRSPPSISIDQIKLLRTDYYEKFASNEVIATLQSNQNIARVFVTWIDAAVEFTILKHEVRLIRLQYANVLKAMKNVSQKWPKKKKFIQGAYKLLLFSKNIHPMTREVYMKLQERGQLAELFDFKASKKRAVRILDEEEEEPSKKEEEPPQVEQEKQEDLKDKITTVQKSMNFLEKAYNIQSMLMNILKETNQDQMDISSSLEAFQEGTNEVGVQVGEDVEIENEDQTEEQSNVPSNDQKE